MGPALSLLLVLAALFGGGPWCLAGALALAAGDAVYQHRRLSRQGLLKKLERYGLT